MASDCKMSKKRARFSDENKHDTENFNSNDSGGSCGGAEQKFPNETSTWSGETLHELGINITYNDSITPQELLRIVPLKYPLGRDLTNYFLWIHINTIEKYIRNSLFHEYLNVRIDTLSRKTANALRRKNFYTGDLPIGLHASGELNFWLQRFETLGMQFGEILYSIVLKRDLLYKADSSSSAGGSVSGGQVPCEYDFQFLFQAFASMFGLHTYHRAEPLMCTSTLQLSRANIAGRADILYCWDISPDEDGSLEELTRVVAVCQVKKQCIVSGQQENRRASASHTNSPFSPPHIPPALIGQHGGNLLIHYKQSVKKNVVYGLIIQETKVTFTALKMTDKQYHGIITGKHEETKPQLMFTRPYDFLIQEDREQLIRPLLELALLQELNFSDINMWTSVPNIT